MMFSSARPLGHFGGPQLKMAQLTLSTVQMALQRHKRMPTVATEAYLDCLNRLLEPLAIVQGMMGLRTWLAEVQMFMGKLRQRSVTGLPLNMRERQVIRWYAARWRELRGGACDMKTGSADSALPHPANPDFSVLRAPQLRLFLSSSPNSEKAMLLANYASDSDAESDAESDADTNAPAPSTSRLAAPAPRASAPAGGAAKKKRGPVKITLDRPKPSSSDDPEASRELADEVKDEREAKKPKLAGRLKGGGPGGSSLLGMLPPPKSKLPVPTTDGKKSLAVINSMAAKPRASLLETAANGELDGDDDPDDVPGRLLLPSSIARAKAKATVQSEPAVDLFGLTPAPAPLKSSSFAQPKAGPSRPLISSAPTVADFVPPPPTPSDPYPGYYLLPSGSWAAYEPAYYHSFFPDNQPDKVKEKGEDGRVGKHWDEYDTRGGEIVDIDVGKGLEEARREEERREKLKKPKVAGEEYEYKTIGQTKGLAAQRHQLTSLLHTAYGQREELEERIQANKKNMRLAGQKYGF